ncbi:hypothetical protein GCM10022403_032890 [Streptomyces coacervatus]|uniref:Uncharacterized protein n=1 Tax=Streptomyces coacervatus TaxID=647381 RepID=A0ABP7HN60_9ACTN
MGLRTYQLAGRNGMGDDGQPEEEPRTPVVVGNYSQGEIHCHPESSIAVRESPGYGPAPHFLPTSGRSV